MPFAVGQQPKQQVADRLTDQQRNCKVADRPARHIPAADRGRGDEGHAHPAGGKQPARDQKAAEVAIAPQNPAQPGPDTQPAFFCAADLPHRFARKDQDEPTDEHEKCGQPEQGHKIAGEGLSIQDAAADVGSQRAGDRPHKHGNAHHTAAAGGRKTDGHQILPRGGDDARAEVVERKRHQKEGQRPRGGADCKQRSGRQQHQRQPFDEETEIDQPGFFAGCSLDRSGAQKLREVPAAVGDDRQQADEQGVVGQSADEKGQNRRRRDEALGQHEQGAISQMDSEVPAVVLPRLGLDIRVRPFGRGHIDLKHTAQQGNSESASCDCCPDHRGFRANVIPGSAATCQKGSPSRASIGRFALLRYFNGACIII